MNRWIRPAALSFGLAAFAIALLIDHWNPLRGTIYALCWAAATVVLVFAERRNRG